MAKTTMTEPHTKGRALEDENSCLNKAAGDEPIFVLRASDELAPKTIMAWVSWLRAQHGDDEKCLGAVDCAAAMEAWQAENGCKVPD